MRATELLKIIQPIHQFGAYEGEIRRLMLDSRAVCKNDVFIALKGTVSDGHKYINNAIRKGARVIITEQIPDEFNENRTPARPAVADKLLFLQVADTRMIVGELAQAFAGHPAKTMKMIGVTGTNGKTTVSTLVYQVLQSLGYNSGLIGTVEIRIGDRVTTSRLTTPDAVRLAEILGTMAESDTAYAVMEVSSHALEQHRVGGIRFDVAAFTNLSQDHLDYHHDMDSYINAKKRLFESLDSDAIAIINRDDPVSHNITEGCRAEIWKFGFRDDRDFRILDEGSDGMVLDLDGTIVSTPLAGRYNAYNIAQAYLICLAFGFTKSSVAGALCEASGAPGRMERVEAASESVPAVFVDYAHTPDALENVLKTLHTVRREGQPLHVVFGCGGDRDRAKRPIMGRIADTYADVITLTSDNPRTEKPEDIIRDIRKGVVRNDEIFVEPNRRKAIRSAILEADTRTIVLLAGKGHETYQEVHGRRNKFDDREIAGKALNEWIARRTDKKNHRSRNSEKEVC